MASEIDMENVGSRTDGHPIIVITDMGCEIDPAVLSEAEDRSNASLGLALKGCVLSAFEGQCGQEDRRMR
jgi:hypothetical protein